MTIKLNNMTAEQFINQLEVWADESYATNKPDNKQCVAMEEGINLAKSILKFKINLYKFYRDE